MAECTSEMQGILNRFAVFSPLSVSKRSWSNLAFSTLAECRRRRVHIRYRANHIQFRMLSTTTFKPKRS
jgi:hypothetical protein